MACRIQELGVSGTLDQAVALVREKFALLLQIMLLTYIPGQMLIAWASEVTEPTLPPSPTAEDLVRYEQVLISSIADSSPLTFLSIFIILPIANAAIIFAVAQTCLGKPVTATESLRFGSSRIVALFWTTTVMGLAIMGGLILFIIPGIVCLIAFSLAANVTVLEDVSGCSALGRSRLLVRSSKWTAFALGSVLTAMSLSFLMIRSLIGPRFVGSAVGVVVDSVLSGFGSAATTVYCFSCRCAVDHFDLEQRVAVVEQSVEHASSHVKQPTAILTLRT